MVDGVDQDATNESGVVETITGGKEFSGSVEHRDPMAPRLSDTPRPDHIPEKFWDPIKGEPRMDALLKSYSELEKQLGGGSKEDEGEDEGGQEDDEQKPEGEPEGEGQEADEGGEGEGGEGDEEQAGDGDAPALAASIEAAQAAYAETGELSAEAREPLKAAGITDEQIDFYLAGVKATEAALRTAAETAAGSADELNAAMAWAATGLSDKEKIAFNAAMGDVDTIKLAVPGLMKAYRDANPGEGKLTNINTGVSRGDVYTHMDEFEQDLSEADRLRDNVKRRKAIAKLRRSREAKSIKR